MPALSQGCDSGSTAVKYFRQDSLPRPSVHAASEESTPVVPWLGAAGREGPPNAVERSMLGGASSRTVRRYA